MNQIILSGRLVKEPELRYSGNGNAIWNNAIAVEDGYGDSKKTYFIDLVAFQKTAENAAQWTFKGQRINVMGKLTKRSYDGKEGQKVWVAEVVVEKIEYTDYKDSKSGGSPANMADGDLPF